MAGYGEDSYDQNSGGSFGGRGRGRGRGRSDNYGNDSRRFDYGGSSYGNSGGNNDWGDGGGGGGYGSTRNGNSGGYGGGDYDDSKPSYRDRRGGRGGRGNGGYGGTRNGYSGGYDNEDDDGSGAFGGGRGRRGGGRGRGGRGGGSRNGGDNGDSTWLGDESREFRKGGDGQGDDKPKERYEPPEPSNEESVLFGSGISSGINFDKYDNISIKVTGENIVPPMSTFEECALRPFLLDNVLKSGYSKPTPVQKHAIPIIKNSRDLMACAQTGSGKTAAFLLPIIHTLVESPTDLITTPSVEPQAVIIAPTRELAIQIHDEARKFAHSSIIKVAIAYGGTTVHGQANRIQRGCHILVATPGRLNDFVERGRISFSSVRFFVLDEADRMLDMGFLPDVEKMLQHETMVPMESRQTLMFSATFPTQIQNLAQKFLNNYLFLAVGVVGGACADVEQVFIEVPKFEKKGKLIEAVKENSGLLTLVFVQEKRMADFIAAYLSENDFPTTSIHGDRLQSQREEALRDFKTGRRPTLVATAVAARGLDIKNVGHVINYDLPQTADEYVHRIGRTGRVGNRGKATSFFDPSFDSGIAGDLVAILEQAGQQVPSFLASYSGGGGGFDSYGGRDVRRGNFGGGGGDGGGCGDWGSSESAQNSAPVEVEEDWG